MSMLRMSAGRRSLGALLIGLAIWLAVAWAL